MPSSTIDQMLRQILDELDAARGSLSEAASWARSDWSDRRSFTNAERDARAAVFATVQDAKNAIDWTKGLIHQARECGPPRNR